MRLYQRAGVLTSNTPALVVFGDAGIGDVDDTLSAAGKVVGPAVARSSGYVTKMTGYLSGQGSGIGDQKVRAVIYANSGGAPAGLVGYSDDVTITDGSAYAWHDFPFSTPAPVTVGVTYWIGYHGDTPMDGSQIKSVSGSGLAYNGGDTFAGGPSDPFGAASTLDTIAHQSLYVTVGQVTPPAPLTIPRYGIATGFTILTRNDAGINFEVSECAAVGAKYIRVDLMQETAWQTAFGKIVTQCELRGLGIIACLRGTAGPIGNSAAATFATTQFNKWRGHQSILAWEYVNEPNLGAPRYTSAQYGGELGAVYDAIKGIDSNATVVTGGLGWDAAGKFSGFWPDALTAGATGSFDCLNIHLYASPSYINWTEGFALDNEDKPVIVTESGATGGNLTTQASTVTAQMRDGRPSSLCIYSMMNLGDNFGLLDSTNARRPAWSAYQTVATS